MLKLSFSKEFHIIVFWKPNWIEFSVSLLVIKCSIYELLHWLAKLRWDFCVTWAYLTIMPSRFLGFLMKGRDLDIPSAATMLTAELDRTTDAGMNALMHDRTAKAQANRNMFLFQKEVEDTVNERRIWRGRKWRWLYEWGCVDTYQKFLKLCRWYVSDVVEYSIAVWWFPYLFNERTRRSKREEEHTWEDFGFPTMFFLQVICFT